MLDDHFAGDVAARYHESVPEMFDPALDLMARLAGLALRHRWAGWDRSPFTGDATSHVSVWQKPRA